MRGWRDVNGVSLRYELAGAGPPTLVLLHEMGGTLETWDEVVALLRGRRPDLRILRYDMRGSGLSEKVRALAFDDLVADLGGLMDALDVTGPVAMAGIAVGAAVAVGYAARHPDRVGKLVLMSLASGIPPERREATQALAAAIRGGGLRARIEARLDATFPQAFRDDSARLAAFRGRALANDPDSYAACYEMLLGLDLAPALASLACPALVLAGEADGTRSPARVAQDAAGIPRHAFEAVGSGHVMAALTPGLVAERMAGFL